MTRETLKLAPSSPKTRRDAPKSPNQYDIHCACLYPVSEAPITDQDKTAFTTRPNIMMNDKYSSEGKRTKQPDLADAYTTRTELLRFYLSLTLEDREKRFMDTARVAEMLGLSTRTIQWWIESGAIKAVSVGRKYRVWIDSVEEFLHRNNMIKE